MEQHWKDILSDQIRSGLTVKQYCEDRSIKKSKFYYWRKKLSISEEGLAGFVALSVKPSRQDSNVVVEYPNGVKLHLQSKVSQSLLRELIYV